MNDEYNPTSTAQQMGIGFIGQSSQTETEEEFSNTISTTSPRTRQFQDKYVAYTIKLPANQLAALQSIWLELKRLYGSHSPDKSGMIQQAVEEWLKRWDGSDRDQLLDDLLQIRADTRRRQYRK